VEYVRDNDIGPGTRIILTLHIPPVLKGTNTIVDGPGGGGVEELDTSVTVIFVILLDLWWSITLSITAVPDIVEILLLSHVDVS